MTNSPTMAGPPIDAVITWGEAAIAGARASLDAGADHVCNRLGGTSATSACHSTAISASCSLRASALAPACTSRGQLVHDDFGRLTIKPSPVGGGAPRGLACESRRDRPGTETACAERAERHQPTATFEPRWQARWAELDLHRTDLEDTSRPTYYLLTMYDYPSGDLHVGHWYVKTPTDALASYHRMHGDNVFFPVGFDAFGLPAENAAIKNNIHPSEWTYRNIEQMRRQLRSMGASFDWDNEVVTCDPAYYRWNQWLFLRFLEAGLAYRATAPVDWCPNDGTLAREQVEGADRRCWRCGAKVEKRDLAQWFLRITKYTDELLDFSGIDWPEPVRIMQTNWIGRSEGAEVVFRSAPDTHIPGGDEIRVFTTRPDTLFGATFMVSPEPAVDA
jgi:leucyl-tRNA synthetase